MLINSIKFVVFAALVVFLYYIVPLKKRWIVLLVSSYIIISFEMYIKLIKNIKSFEIFDETFLMVIATIGNEYVVASFGINETINPFEEKLSAAYPAAEIVYSEAIV